MGSDIMAVVVFVVVVIASCKLWNVFFMRCYEAKDAVKNGDGMKYGTYIDRLQKLDLAGVKEDGNSDFEIQQAVKKIKLSDNTRIKIDD